MRKIVIRAVVLLAVFLLGYIPSCLSARNAQGQKAQLESQLRLAELTGQLGMASYEVNRNNYANATQYTTKFFNGLQKVSDDTVDKTLKQKLQTFVARRNEITSNLAEVNVIVKEKLAQMYADFYQITVALQNQQS
jgi:hypothetical protein